MNFIVGQAVTLTELNYFQPMHYSKHTRTSSYINSALPSQGQALSLGGGKAYLIHVPLQIGCIGINTLNGQVCQIPRCICNSARQRVAMFGRKKVWRQMETGPRDWSNEYTSVRCHGKAFCGFQNLNQYLHQ